MSVIRRIDTLGVKTKLDKGELGLDMVDGSSEKGRVYVGTGTENVPLAKLDDLAAVETLATAGQTDISVVSSSDIILKIDGMVQSEGTDYTIVDATTVRMVTPLADGNVIDVVDTSDIATALENLGVEKKAEKGQPNGYAGLDGSGMIPAAQLPSYVDDVVEVATKADLPVTGEVNKVYVVVADESKGGDTSTYRWSGAAYALITDTLDAADVKSLYEGNADTNAYTDAEKALVGVGTGLTTTATTLTTGVNELVTSVGTLSLLPTVDKTNLVNAIKETYDNWEALNDEVNDSHVAIGASVNPASGLYVPHSGKNYINTNTTVTEDIVDLDAQAKVNADGLAALTTVVEW